ATACSVHISAPYPGAWGSALTRTSASSASGHIPALLSEANCCDMREHPCLAAPPYRAGSSASPGRLRACATGRVALHTHGVHCLRRAKSPNIAASSAREDTLANAPLRLGAVEWGLIALQSMLWGSSYFFVAVAVHDEVPILTFVAIRGVFASIMLVAIVT